MKVFLSARQDDAATGVPQERQPFAAGVTA